VLYLAPQREAAPQPKGHGGQVRVCMYTRGRLNLPVSFGGTGRFFDNSNRNGWLESWSVGVMAAALGAALPTLVAAAVRRLKNPNRPVKCTIGHFGTDGRIVGRSGTDVGTDKFGGERYPLDPKLEKPARVETGKQVRNSNRFKVGQRQSTLVKPKPLFISGRIERGIPKSRISDLRLEI